MSIKKRSLWSKFFTIAQPYFLPEFHHSGWAMLLLIIAMFIFLFGLLFIMVIGIVMLGVYLSPAMTEKIAPGLAGLVNGIIVSPLGLIVIGLLLISMICFALFARHLRVRRQAWILLGTVLFLSICVTGINVAFSYIGNYFTNALVKKNQEMAYLFIAVYFCGFLVGIPITALYSYVQNFMGMRWRQWLTDNFLQKYFSNRCYYDIENRGEIDNPDQRIMEDIRSFTKTSLAFMLIILGSLMDLVSFTGILWSKSVFLVSVVLSYSLIGTLLTVLIGRRLVHLNFNQLHYEADFRYSLVHARDNAESIAFYQGERPERENIGKRFLEVLKNFSLLIGWQRNLSFFTSAYNYLPLVLPFLVMFPQYFSGKIEYGDMVQANFAFMQVYAALSLIVSQIEQITNFAAGVERLSAFSDAVAIQEAAKPGIKSIAAKEFALDNLTLMTPNRKRILFKNLSLNLPVEKNLIIVGPSGAGKSSLLRAIAGLWTEGEGGLSRPPLADIFFLPQKPYMLLGSLRDQLLYPKLQREISEEEMLQVLQLVNLPDLPERVGGFDVQMDWADVLSLGEQQRLAFARLFLNRPHFAVLDEATSALDIENEAQLYRQLADLNIHYISVGHRPSILDYHDCVLELKGPENWHLLPVAEYKSEIEAA